MPDSTVKTRLPAPSVQLAVPPKISSTFEAPEAIASAAEVPAVLLAVRPVMVTREVSDAIKSTVLASDTVKLLDAPGYGLLWTIDRTAKAGVATSSGAALRPYPSARSSLSIATAVKTTAGSPLGHR